MIRRDWFPARRLMQSRHYQFAMLVSSIFSDFHFGFLNPDHGAVRHVNCCALS